MLQPPAWHADAACREHPELNWFPGRNDDWSAPLAICATCPVRADCLLAGRGEAGGIWGGRCS
jgi:hypothetical protein